MPMKWGNTTLTGVIFKPKNGSPVNLTKVIYIPKGGSAVTVFESTIVNQLPTFVSAVKQSPATYYAFTFKNPYTSELKFQYRIRDKGGTYGSWSTITIQPNSQSTVTNYIGGMGAGTYVVKIEYKSYDGTRSDYHGITYNEGCDWILPPNVTTATGVGWADFTIQNPNSDELIVAGNFYADFSDGTQAQNSDPDGIIRIPGKGSKLITLRPDYDSEATVSQNWYTQVCFLYTWDSSTRVSQRRG